MYPVNGGNYGNQYHIGDLNQNDWELEFSEEIEGVKIYWMGREKKLEPNEFLPGPENSSFWNHSTETVHVCFSQHVNQDGSWQIWMQCRIPQSRGIRGNQVFALRFVGYMVEPLDSWVLSEDREKRQGNLNYADRLRREIAQQEERDNDLQELERLRGDLLSYEDEENLYRLSLNLKKQ